MGQSQPTNFIFSYSCGKQLQAAKTKTIGNKLLKHRGE